MSDKELTFTGTYTTLKCLVCGQIISNHSVMGEVVIFHKDCYIQQLQALMGVKPKW